MKNGAIGNIATTTQSLIPLSAAVVNLVRQALACSSNIACPVSFEFQNYTIITSKCKGPEYPPDLCCSSFKEFACPFVDSLNDLRNDCSKIMFSYITINGNYPAGLFASICREGKDGLECPAVPPPPSMLSENANKNLGRNIRELLPITMLIVASLALNLQYF